MPTTHCWPSGSANPPTVVLPPGPNFANNIAATGTKRGILVFLHGLNAGAPTDYVFPVPSSDNGGLFPARSYTTSVNLAAIGWQVLNPVMPGDGFSPNGGVQAFYNDINTDSGHGTRVVNTWLEWWDHLVWYIRLNISATLPIVVMGGSMGAYFTLWIASKRQQSIAGYIAHHPPTSFGLINPAFTPPVTFSGINVSGAVFPTTGLNAVTVPGLLGWGSIDIAIDYPQSGDTISPTIYSTALAAGANISPNDDGTGTSSNGGGGGSQQENHWWTSSVDHANPYNDDNQIVTWFKANLPHN